MIYDNGVTRNRDNQFKTKQTFKNIAVESGGSLADGASVKTAAFTAERNAVYLVDTNGGAITVTLPAYPVAGDKVELIDAQRTWDTNNVTVARNGQLIGGVAANDTLDIEGGHMTYRFVSAAYGWTRVTQ